MEITTIRAFLARRQEIETRGSEDERACLKGLDALATLSPNYLEAIGDVPLVSGEVSEITPDKPNHEAASGEEDELPF